MPVPAPIILKKENDYIRWQQTACHRYTITNKTSPFAGYTLKVNVTRIDGQNEVQIVSDIILLPGESYDLDIRYRLADDYGGDGVYQLSAVPIISAPINPQVDSGTNYKLFRYVLPAVSPTDYIQSLSATGTPRSIYEAPINGTSDFTNPPTSYANLVNAIGLWNNGNIVEIIPPNGISSSGLNVPVIPFYQIAFFASPFNPLVGLADELEVWINGAPEYIFPTISCYWAIPEPSVLFPPTHVTAFNVNGSNILSRYYNLATEENLFLNDINNYFLANNINATAGEFGGGAYVWSQPCLQIDSITYSEIEDFTQETLIDYIYEFCDIYNCYTKLERKHVCTCKDCTGCKKKSKEYELMNEMANLLYGGGLRLVELDRLAYAGDFGFYQRRALDSSDIANYFTRIRSIAFQCGYGCEEKKPCGC